MGSSSHKKRISEWKAESKTLTENAAHRYLERKGGLGVPEPELEFNQYLLDVLKTEGALILLMGLSSGFRYERVFSDWDLKRILKKEHHFNGCNWTN